MEKIFSITDAITATNQAVVEAQQSAGKGPPGAKRQEHALGVKRGKKTTRCQAQECNWRQKLRNQLIF